ncbi:UNVERIFIED_CONTAM: putative transcription factor [Sesamum latifolium]|uniref:Transcription factor n=1 Tax=Sesamum latifolium TaxID=2727402 RepID=A0AAW2TUM0_9LAMI
MAKNREPQKVVESESKSGEEKRDGASSEEVGSSESESDSEPEQTQKPPSLPTAALKKSQPQSSAKPQQPSSSSDEEESGSESESESEGPESNVRPIATKPMDDSQKPNGGARKVGLKPSASEPSTPAKSTGAKRLAEEKESEAKGAKRSKRKPEPEAELENSEKKSSDDSKKQLFQRLWSEDDEIVILKGMIDYAEKKKSDPVADLNDFHDFIKDSLHVDVTRTQLQDKIRRLKKKYENNKSKEKEGKDRAFSKPHEQKAYELSKQVWGNESGKENGGEKIVGSPKANGSVRKTQSKRVNAVEDGESQDVKSMVVANSDVDWLSRAKTVSSNDVSMEERILRIGAELFEGDKPVEGETEWRKLRLEEMEAYLKRLDLMRAQTKLVLDVLKSKNH